MGRFHTYSTPVAARVTEVLSVSTDEFTDDVDFPDRMLGEGSVAAGAASWREPAPLQQGGSAGVRVSGRHRWTRRLMSVRWRRSWIRRSALGRAPWLQAGDRAGNAVIGMVSTRRGSTQLYLGLLFIWSVIVLVQFGVFLSLAD